MDYREILKQIESKSERAFLIDRMIENAFDAAENEEAVGFQGGLDWFISWLVKSTIETDGGFSPESAGDLLKDRVDYVTSEYRSIMEGVADGRISPSDFDSAPSAFN